MIKKIFAIVICAVFMLGAAVPAFAGSDDSVFSSITTELFYSFDGLEENSGFQMRGFTASPDGKYLFGGFLQNYRHVTMVDVAKGERVGEYLPEIENDDGVTANSNYPKGIAVDCRGYLFVGITHDVPASPYISLACVNPTPDADGYLQEVSHITENLGADHTGINGVAAQKIGDKILVYVATCYDKDTIRCYDVTDVENMHLYSEFGVDGVVDYNELTGSQKDPGYLTVDVDGYIYLCYLAAGASGSKGSHVMKISADGKNVIEQAEVSEAYGICTAGDYVFVSTYGSDIVVLNKSDLSKVAEFEVADIIGTISGCYYAGDCLWIGTHGDGNTSLPGEIYRTNAFALTRDPKETETLPTELITVAPETEAPETQPADPSARDSFVLFDLTDIDVVNKVTPQNSVEIEYDETYGCMKVTVTGDDPYLLLPMAKATYFDGDKYCIMIINYMTEYDVSGEIYFTTKVNRDLPSNHLMYDMEAVEEFTDLEIDMREDDQGMWEGQVRYIRIDPVAQADGEEVFYFKSITMAVEEEEVTEAPVVTEAKDTEPAETKTGEEVETKAGESETKENKPADSQKTENTPKKDNENKFPIWIIFVAVGVVAVAVVLALVLTKKKK